MRKEHCRLEAILIRCLMLSSWLSGGALYFCSYSAPGFCLSYWFLWAMGGTKAHSHQDDREMWDEALARELLRVTRNWIEGCVHYVQFLVWIWNFIICMGSGNVEGIRGEGLCLSISYYLGTQHRKDAEGIRGKGRLVSIHQVLSGYLAGSRSYVQQMNRMFSPLDLVVPLSTIFKEPPE